MSRSVRSICLLSLCLPAAQPASGQPCPGAWSDQFDIGDLFGQAQALIVYDDGSGPALDVGGNQFAACRQPGPPENLARWNGTTWSPVGGGLDSGIYALAVFDEDGAGPAASGMIAANADPSGAGCVSDRWFFQMH